VLLSAGIGLFAMFTRLVLQAGFIADNGWVCNGYLFSWPPRGRAWQNSTNTKVQRGVLVNYTAPVPQRLGHQIRLARHFMPLIFIKKNKKLLQLKKKLSYSSMVRHNGELYRHQ
jgi:hypothetical protein